MYPVIRLNSGGVTAVHYKEQESREVSLKMRLVLLGRLIAKIVSGLDNEPSPIIVTADIEILYISPAVTLV